MEKTGIIYKIENIVNGKVYIGQTMRSYERRIQCHYLKLRKQYHNNRYLQNAFNKYGEENFKTSIVGYFSVDEIDEAEKRWIRIYKEKNMSYNIEEGGNYVKEIAEETRIKLSNVVKASWKDEQIRNKRIQNLKRGKENSNSRAVICITDMKVFDSMTEAGEYYGINMKAIYGSISRGNIYCRSPKGKLEFDYYYEGKTYEPKKFIHGQAKKIICLTTGEIFDSMAIAAKTYNLETTNIAKTCKGRQRSTGKLADGTKLRWAYYED